MSTNQVLRDGLVDYLPQIRRVISKIARHGDVVDDISQEVCVRVIEKEELWKQERNNLNSWINAIARNLTINYIAKKKELPLEEREDYLLYPEDETFSEKQIEWVITQFQTLSQKQQQILNMKYYRGMTVTQIGKELGVTQPAISQHVTLALKILRKKAQAQGLIAVLLPWNWDCILSMQVVIMNKIKLGIILSCLILLGFLGYGVFINVFGSVGEGLKIEVPVFTSLTNKAAAQRGRDDMNKSERMLSVPKIDDTSSVSDAGLNETSKLRKTDNIRKVLVKYFKFLDNVAILEMERKKIQEYYGVNSNEYADTIKRHREISKANKLDGKKNIELLIESLKKDSLNRDESFEVVYYLNFHNGIYMFDDQKLKIKKLIEEKIKKLSKFEIEPHHVVSSFYLKMFQQPAIKGTEKIKRIQEINEDFKKGLQEILSKDQIKNMLIDKVTWGNIDEKKPSLFEK